MKATLYTVLLLSLLPWGAEASETLGVLPDSAAGLGMAGGRYANLSDPSTVRTNPANLLRLTAPAAQVNLGLWYGDITFTNTLGQSIKMDNPWKLLGSLFYAAPIGSVDVGRDLIRDEKTGKLICNPAPLGETKMAWGIGINTPYGLDSHWPKNGILKYLIPHEATLLTLDLTPAFAFRVTDTLSVGVGLDIMYSQLNLKQQFPWSRLTRTAARDGEFEFDGEGWGIGGFAGITWEPVRGHRFSLTGRLPITVKYDGDFTASNVPAGAGALGISSRSDFASEIKYPGSLAAGYGWDVNDRLTIGLDVQWAANSSHSDVPLNIGRNQVLLGSSGVPLNWKDSWEGGLGLQYKLDQHWVLRAGYLFSQSSQPDATYTPSVPSGQRHLTSVGVGWHNKANAIDLAYAYVAYPDRTVSNNIQPAFNGRYQIGWHVLSVSYTHSF